MSNCRVIPAESYTPESNRFCQGYVSEVARTSEGRVIAIVERECLRTARPVEGRVWDNVTGEVTEVFFCTMHHPDYQEPADADY